MDYETEHTIKYTTEHTLLNIKHETEHTNKY